MTKTTCVRAAKHQPRGHVAIIADDAPVHACFLGYETRCHTIGVRVIRVFRQYMDAERRLEIVSAAREPADIDRPVVVSVSWGSRTRRGARITLAGEPL